MNYEEFADHVLRNMHEALYEDTEGREILIIRLLDAFVMTQKAVDAEREAIAQMFEDSPPLVQFAQNNHGGCAICGFTPRIAAGIIKARK